MAGRKIFVGSLPLGIDEGSLRAEFGRYGQVEEVFVKPNCEPGRQWGFVTFASPEQAIYAKEACDRILTFPGGDRPVDVKIAKNQGMFGQEPLGGVSQPPKGYGGGSDGLGNHMSVAPPAQAPKKIFVGSLPDGIDELSLRAEFSKYGAIEEVYIKQNCEPGRQWAFITFDMHEQAQQATTATNGILQFHGAIKPCEVKLARNQGMFGQAPLDGVSRPPAGQQHQPHVVYAPVPAVVPAPHMSPGGAAPRKIFVGSLPDWVTEATLRAEFSRFGQITDVYVKTGCEPGRQWAFVTFATPEQAQQARDGSHRILIFPGCEKPCEVTIARNQGMFGQNPTTPVAGAMPMQVLPPQQAALPHQPPPPPGPPPAHLTPWRMYKTVTGIPYYHNSTTGVTQWECPPDLQAMPSHMDVNSSVRYTPY